MALRLILAVVVLCGGGVAWAAIDKDNDASPLFACDQPLRNVTALIYTDDADNNYTLHTVLDYRAELLHARRVDVEPVHVLPKLCRGAITAFPRLRTLTLVLTGIRDIEPGAFADLPRLRRLNLAHNRLERILRGVFNPLSGVEELLLAGNRIYDIAADAFDNMTALRTLDLSFNHVQYVDEMWFKNTPQLTTLNLVFNRIGALEAHSFRQLNGTPAALNLMLMNNTIASIHRDAFAGIRELGTLRLTANRLRYIDDQVFQDVASIGALQLEDNEIFCLSERLLNRTRVQEIRLAGNPIICNCMTKLEEWSVHTNTRTYNSVKDLERCGVRSQFIETTTQPPEGVLVEL